MATKPRREDAPKEAGLRSGSRLALGVFLLALLVRGIYLADSRDNPTFQTPVVDSQTYDGLARRPGAGPT